MLERFLHVRNINLMVSKETKLHLWTCLKQDGLNGGLQLQKQLFTNLN